jgi:ribosome recycling factor
MDLNNIIDDARSHMDKAINHLEEELSKVRAGKANPSMLEGILVSYYGSMMPINQVANVNTPDARTLVIQPWEKAMLDPIEKGIQAANIGINPQNDGAAIKLFMPPLTEERRKEFVKKAHGLAEAAKVSIRNIRRDSMEHVKKLKSENVSEDDVKNGEKKMQDMTDAFITTIDKHLASKEKEIMTV